MGSFRSGRGGRSGFKRKRDENGGGGDFRWKKAKQRRGREPHAISGDALGDEALMPSDGRQETEKATHSQQKETSRDIKARQLAAKRRRREQHEAEREQADAQIRSAPHEYLWEQYSAWAGDKLTSVERAAEKWGAEQVQVVEDTGESVMAHVKTIVGHDYLAQGGWKKGGVAGVAVIALSPSAVRAVGVAKRLYDGRPVGKLFSKHIKIGEQKEWLRGCCEKGLAPSAAGTAKRVGRLVQEGDLTLKHTVALVIDFSRDMRLLNIVDIEATRQELFEFLHERARAFIAEGRMKVVLCIPKQQATKLEDVKDKLMEGIVRKAGDKKGKAGVKKKD